MSDRPPLPPRSVAAIDIGTNSIRLEIAQVDEKGDVALLEQARRPVRLGQDTFVKGRLSRRSIASTIEILRDYCRIVETYGIQNVRVIASSAVYEASNRDSFIDRVVVATGLEVEAIEALEELRLTVLAIRSVMRPSDFGRGLSMILDVGGGNVLLAILKHGSTVLSRAFPVGAIRMRESLDIFPASQRHITDLLQRQIAVFVHGLDAEHQLERIRKVFFVGGDVRFLAETIGTATDNPHRHQIAILDMAAFIEENRTIEPQDLARKFGLTYEETETLVPALLVYQAVLAATQAAEASILDVSMRDGMTREMAMEAVGQKDKVEEASLIQVSRNLAERYHCDMLHADKVAELSVELFDQLIDVHCLPTRYRTLLYVAGILHDVGSFVSSRSHHKHSFYVVSNSDLFGLRSGENSLVANVVRYHRRSIPKRSHPEFMTEPREKRVIISKLAALLRIANALDRGHAEKVQDLQVEMREDTVVLHVRGQGSFELEQQTLFTRGDLFSDIFGLSIRLEAD